MANLHSIAINSVGQGLGLDLDPQPILLWQGLDLGLQEGPGLQAHRGEDVVLAAPPVHRLQGGRATTLGGPGLLHLQEGVFDLMVA